MLSEACERLPAPPQPVDLRPVELALTGEKHNKSKCRGHRCFGGQWQLESLSLGVIACEALFLTILKHGS